MSFTYHSATNCCRRGLLTLLKLLQIYLKDKKHKKRKDWGNGE